MKKEEKNDIASENVAPGRTRRIAHLGNLMVAVFDFNDGPMANPDPPHSHPHEQITYVAEGELLFYKETNQYHLSKGDLITIPPGMLHSIQTLTSHARLVDSFFPLREDFLKSNKQIK